MTSTISAQHHAADLQTATSDLSAAAEKRLTDAARRQVCVGATGSCRGPGPTRCTACLCAGVVGCRAVHSRCVERQCAILAGVTGVVVLLLSLAAARATSPPPYVVDRARGAPACRRSRQRRHASPSSRYTDKQTTDNRYTGDSRDASPRAAVVRAASEAHERIRVCHYAEAACGV